MSAVGETITMPPLAAAVPDQLPGTRARMVLVSTVRNVCSPIWTRVLCVVGVEGNAHLQAGTSGRPSLYVWPIASTAPAGVSLT